MKPTSFKWFSVIAGTAFLILLLVVLVFIPCPSPSQSNFFRVLLAIAAAGFAAALPGAIKVQNKLVSATSSIGVFVLIYLINPAGWSDGDCGIKNLRLTIYVDGQVKGGVELVVPSLGQRFATDDFGRINMEYAPAQMKYPVSFLIKYKSELDTSIAISESLPASLELRLSSKKGGDVVVSSADNGINYSYQGLDFNISVHNEGGVELLYQEILSYDLKVIDDTAFITPNLATLKAIEEGRVVKDVGLDGEGFIDFRLPALDIKVANNSNDALFLNEISLKVTSSKADNNALIVPIGLSKIGFTNIGWGVAKDVEVDFNIAPKIKYNGWQAGSYTYHYDFPAIGHRVNGQDLTSVKIDINELLHFPKQAYKMGEEYSYDKNSIEAKKYKALVGDYYEGGMAFGTCKYTNTDGTKKEFRFETFFEIPQGFGSGIEMTAAYNALLKKEGEDYTITVPASQGIKPKDFDRFSVSFSCPQSSGHVMKLAFVFNNKTIELPLPISLKYFTTPEIQSSVARK